MIAWPFRRRIWCPGSAALPEMSLPPRRLSSGPGDECWRLAHAKRHRFGVVVRAHNRRHLPPLRRYVMRQTVLAVLFALALPAVALAQVSNLHGGAITAVVQKAVNDPARAADKTNDARRKVALVMTFAQVKPGQKVVELIPGSGYFTACSARSWDRGAMSTRCGRTSTRRRTPMTSTLRRISPPIRTTPTSAC